MQYYLGFFLRNLLPPRIASISTIMTITIARAIMPVVSAETKPGVETGVGVRSASFSDGWLAVAVGVTEAAVWAVSKVCKVPVRKVTATRTKMKMTRERRM